MKSFVKLAATACAVSAAAFGLALAPGEAAAGTVGAYQQPETGAVSISSGTSEINVMIINRTDADKCTVTATRKDKKAGTKTLTRSVNLTDLNQRTAIANFRGVFDKTDYTIAGSCVGPKPASDPATGDPVVTDETVTTNLLGGNGKAVVHVNNAVMPRYGECLQIVKGTAWDLGLRGQSLQMVVGLATQFCPR
ncbi:MAG: hypothetical protein LBE07_04315 [Gordonia sp. (in: high G+C Gram-positive bacteria)]|jgi:hypothetical protein|nr:hypothetical protein [Gordonia sp. (in: high G+C Gram-positive bacteria)]